MQLLLWPDLKYLALCLISSAQLSRPSLYVCPGVDIPSLSQFYSYFPKESFSLSTFFLLCLSTEDKLITGSCVHAPRPDPTSFHLLYHCVVYITTNQLTWSNSYFSLLSFSFSIRFSNFFVVHFVCSPSIRCILLLSPFSARVSSFSFVHFVLCVSSRWIDCSGSLVYPHPLPPPPSPPYLPTVPWYNFFINLIFIIPGVDPGTNCIHRNHYHAKRTLWSCTPAVGTLVPPGYWSNVCFFTRSGSKI